jgi:hypothetical protein
MKRIFGGTAQPLSWEAAANKTERRQERNEKGKQPGLCPVCGGERKSATTTSPRAVRASLAVVVSTAPTIVTYSIRAESSDDETASELRHSC